MGFGFSGVIDYARGDYKLLGRDEKTVVVGRLDTTGWRLGIHNSKFHIELQRIIGFQKEFPNFHFQGSIFGVFMLNLRGVRGYLMFQVLGLQLWCSCQLKGYRLHQEILMVLYLRRVPEWTIRERVAQYQQLIDELLQHSTLSWRDRPSNLEDTSGLRKGFVLFCHGSCQGLAWWCKWRLNRRDNHSHRWRNFVVWFPRFLPRGPTRKTRSLRDGSGTTENR